VANGNDTQIELDERCATIPWEMLDTPRDAQDDGAMQREPWAIRTRLLRKLRTDDFRLQTQDATRQAGVLIIGEPDCAPSTAYPRLPGARREARAVRDLLDAAGLPGGTRALIAPDKTPGPNAVAVIQALLEQPWRVIHISGHGAEPGDGDPRGVVLSGGVFLGPREIKSMRTVPELVFVNCCFSGARDVELIQGSKDPLDYSRPAFAANVAAELIRIGVKCVVATGWAVDDQAAEVFATTFYATLLRGNRFIDAVAEARRAAYASGDTTWSAYQCYGDPDWRLLAGLPDAQRPPPPRAAPPVASMHGLAVALRTLATRAEFQGDKGEAAHQVLGNLEQRFAGVWGGHGDVAEAFGLAWEALGDTDAAIRWFEAATGAVDGRASFRSTERLHNLRTRREWEKLQGRIGLPGRAAAKGSAQKQRKQLQQDAAKAREAMAGAREELLKLAAIAPTSERLSLIGSVDKRLAMIACALDEVTVEAAEKQIRAMRDQYQKALDAAPPPPASDGFYPATNVVAALLALGEPVPEDLESRTHALVAGKNRSDPDFWSVAAVIEMDAWRALAGGTLAAQLGPLRDRFDDLHDRVPKVTFWRSVHDQTQFVMLALHKRGKLPDGSPESQAAQDLLDRLAAFAEFPPPPSP
jgi:hypothetical protein